ncbi:MAG: hypothetical protein A3J62_02695 [Candidatus Buchananbacteria bacterium RIFCSPHIGHO2_02_FULL_38_8]|uniref:Transcription regulator TrmB N-terminal domain-containing protein n=2 Tax=Candidatus Buchananiibacteriota TaxID=1817903 RepID=A0A1G1Y065_9BACT|nr:MAG: hypothetical protein A2731_01810 [Candidatus Buchananbacteria bacterium RIFCSPHIGHO2_01_FULL_39_8]OGY47562.1 MAG: hypothetical protein A3J62_02695 [Candidatus Buchananbacteria bacterium RIFCSPHIGHO2_02_FULL_38_8]
MSKDLTEQLANLGFTDHQAKLYLAGLKLGTCLMIHLSKAARVKRSTAYYAIEELERRRFFSTKKIGKRTYYLAASPDKLVSMTLNRLKFVRKIYPHLKSIQNSK